MPQSAAFRVVAGPLWPGELVCDRLERALAALRPCGGPGGAAAGPGPGGRGAAEGDPGRARTPELEVTAVSTAEERPGGGATEGGPGGDAPAAPGAGPPDCDDQTVPALVVTLFSVDAAGNAAIHRVRTVETLAPEREESYRAVYEGGLEVAFPRTLFEACPGQPLQAVRERFLWELEGEVAAQRAGRPDAPSRAFLLRTALWKMQPEDTMYYRYSVRRAHGCPHFQAFGRLDLRGPVRRALAELAGPGESAGEGETGGSSRRPALAPGLLRALETPRCPKCFEAACASDASLWYGDRGLEGLAARAEGVVCDSCGGAFRPEPGPPDRPEVSPLLCPHCGALVADYYCPVCGVLSSTGRSTGYAGLFHCSRCGACHQGSPDLGEHCPECGAFYLRSRGRTHRFVCPGRGAAGAGNAPASLTSDETGITNRPGQAEILGSCALCQEPLDWTQRVVSLPCAPSHVFHLACLFPQMLEGRYACPFGCGFYLRPEESQEGAGGRGGGGVGSDAR